MSSAKLDGWSMREYCLNVQPVMQPVPMINDLGDCFACAFTAVLRYLFPENQPDFERVLEYFKNNLGRYDSTWPGYEMAIRRVKEDGYKIEHARSLILPELNLEYNSCDFYDFTPYPYQFNDDLEGWLKSGYIALQRIDYYGRGPINPAGRRNISNHVVIVDGVRRAEESEYYVHIACSKDGTKWVKTYDFIHKHGAGAWLLIRRCK